MTNLWASVFIFWSTNWTEVGRKTEPCPHSGCLQPLVTVTEHGEAWRTREYRVLVEKRYSVGIRRRELPHTVYFFSATNLYLTNTILTWGTITNNVIIGY